jgi:hypothetical protein
MTIAPPVLVVDQTPAVAELSAPQGPKLLKIDIYKHFVNDFVHKYF